jgi:penicillin-binding protein 1A
MPFGVLRYRKGRFLVMMLRGIIYIGVLSFLAIIAVVIFCSFDLPKIPDLRQANHAPMHRILDDKHRVVVNYGNIDKSYIYFSDLPDHLIEALVATEDRRFFSHYGIDPFGIARALFANIRKGYVSQGASTITQQLAKILVLSPEKTIKRKIQQMLLAFRLEMDYEKEEIMEIYLNKAYFGSGNYGIAAASTDYFDKEVNQLELNEAAMLVGLLKAPSKYSPKSSNNLVRLRTKQILNNMVAAGFLNEDELLIAEYQDNAWHNNYENSRNYLYYTDWIREKTKDLSIENTTDLKIVTFLDSKLQKISAAVINKYFTDYSEKLAKSQISLLAMKPDGRIIMIQGGNNYSQTQYNRAMYAKRQPGSLFKLFVYLTAIGEGYRNDDQVIDHKVSVGKWSPDNYNQEFLGKMTLRSAFVRSINSVAVLLSEEVGRNLIIKKANSLGINSNMKNLPALALGTSEVSLLELVTAYAHIANNGYQVKPRAINYITDSLDDIVSYGAKASERKVIHQKNKEQMDELLYSAIEWGTGKNAKITDLKVRGKTGTTQNHRDAWFIGYTDDIVMGVWIGNDDGTALDNISGGGLPAKIWRDIIIRYENDSY